MICIISCGNLYSSDFDRFINKEYPDLNHPARKYLPVQIIHKWYPHQKKQMRAFIKAMQATNIGGFVINLGIHDNDYSKYLRDPHEDKRIKTFAPMVVDAGFQLWIYDERGYPSGNAGPLVIKDNPEFQVRGISCLRRNRQPAGVGSLKMENYETFIKAFALPRKPDGSYLNKPIKLDFNPKNHILSWDLPAGNDYDIFALRIKKLEWLVKAKTYNVDLLNPEITRKFISLTHEKYRKLFGDELTRKITGIFTDEPGLPVHGCATHFREKYAVTPWTPGLDRIFLEKYGYDLMDNAQCLFVDMGDYKKIRRDYWQLITDLFSDNYFGQISEWCSRFGIESGGHVYGEETLSMQLALNGSLFDCMRHQQTPGVDRLFVNNPKDSIIADKTVASVAHLYGRKNVMTESSVHIERTEGGSFTPEDILNSMTAQFMLGINTLASYFNVPRDLPRDYYDRLLLCLGRLKYIMNSSRHIAPVLVLIPMTGAWERYKPVPVKMWKYGEPVAFKMFDDVKRLEKTYAHMLRTLSDSQWDYDLINNHGFASCTVSPEAISTEYETFKTVIVFDTGYFVPEVEKQLDNCLKANIPVIVMRLPGEQLGDWAAGNKSKIKIVDTTTAAAEYLDDKVKKDFILDQKDPDIWYLRRQRESKGQTLNIYLVYNGNMNKNKDIKVTLASSGTARIYDPWTGESSLRYNGDTYSLNVPSGRCVVIMQKSEK